MKHLDIGSGLLPKNPYNAEEVYGIDIQDNKKASKDQLDSKAFFSEKVFLKKYFSTLSLTVRILIISHRS